MKNEKEVFDGMEDVAGLLRDVGEKARSADLSVEAQRETRRRVAEILDHGHAEAPYWNWKRILAACAVPAAACVVVVFLVFNRGPRGDGQPGQLASADIDAQIRTVRENLGQGLGRLDEKVAEEVRSSYFEMSSGGLKRRIELSLFSISRELHGSNEGESNVEM